MLTIETMMKYFTLLFLTFSYWSLHSDDYEIIYNGEDVTRPVNRFDNRLEYQEGVDAVKGKAIIYTLRVDTLTNFANGWKLGLRADLPYWWFYCPHNAPQCNLPYCYDSQHVADSLFQALVITPNYGKWTYGFGAKFIFPTAGDNLEIGMGKYQVLPTVAFRYMMDEWIDGSYVGLLVRQDFDVGGYASAPTVNQTFIQPFINIPLPNNWFIYSSPEMIYNWESSQWFIPFDLMVGKMITERIVLSLEYESGIVQGYPKYSQELEFRIGYFF